MIEALSALMNRQPDAHEMSLYPKSRKLIKAVNLWTFYGRHFAAHLGMTKVIVVKNGSEIFPIIVRDTQIISCFGFPSINRA
jgi:hypothetical protein